jgi:putative ABC transport system permease protein
MVIGLASVIIGTSMFKKLSVMKATTAVIIGSIVYKACVAAAIELGMRASDLKLITAVLFLVILVLSSDRKRRMKVNS